MIPLPLKLVELLRNFDQRKMDLIQGWMMAQGDLPGEWSLASDNSALVLKSTDPPIEGLPL